MTGMKEGAGEDPFAEDVEATGQDPVEQSDTEAVESQGSSRSDVGDRREARPEMQIPYKFRRDGVQDGRNRVPLFLQPETKRAEREGIRELEDRFDDDVSLTDLREALVTVGLQHMDEVADQLEDWGYGMTFDE